MKPDNQKTGWQRPPLDKLLVIALSVVCAGLLSADFLIDKHAVFAFEDWFGFYAGFGFLAYLGIVFSAIGLRKIIKRDENYYDG